MYQVKVRHGDKVYNYTREKYDNSVYHGQWTFEDEKIFIKCLGLPKLEDDGTVARERWPISRLEKLLWYKNCLTLRSNFDKINASKLNKELNKMIKDEIDNSFLLPSEVFEKEKIVETQFKKVNCL